MIRLYFADGAAFDVDLPGKLVKVETFTEVKIVETVPNAPKGRGRPRGPRKPARKAPKDHRVKDGEPMFVKALRWLQAHGKPATNREIAIGAGIGSPTSTGVYYERYKPFFQVCGRIEEEWYNKKTFTISDRGRLYLATLGEAP